MSRRDGTIHVERFPYRLADGEWHKVALIISGSQVELLVDCHPLYRRLLRPGAPDTNFTKPFLQLWVGQRSTNHFLFKVIYLCIKTHREKSITIITRNIPSTFFISS